MMYIEKIALGLLLVTCIGCNSATKPDIERKKNHTQDSKDYRKAVINCNTHQEEIIDSLNFLSIIEKSILDAIDSIHFYNDSLYPRLSKRVYWDISREMKWERDSFGMYYTIAPENHTLLQHMENHTSIPVTNIKAYYFRYKFDKKGGVNDFVLEVWKFSYNYKINKNHFDYAKRRRSNYPTEILYQTPNTLYIVHNRSTDCAGLLRKLSEILESILDSHAR